MSQTWNSQLYDQKHAFVWERGAEMLDLLQVQPGERILDLGCGTGHLTARLAALQAEVEGMDSSEEMLAKARAAYADIPFWQADAASFQVERPFDAVFSNAALHWVTDAGGAVRSIAAALKPGGRFVAEFGGKHNVATIARCLIAALAERGYAAAHPWYFPSIAEYSALLEKHGLETRKAWHFERMTELDDETTGLRDWVSMFGERMLAAAPAAEREAILADFEERARPTLFSNGRWHADYWRIRVVAVKTAQ